MCNLNVIKFTITKLFVYYTPHSLYNLGNKFQAYLKTLYLTKMNVFDENSEKLMLYIKKK